MGIPLDALKIALATLLLSTAAVRSAPPPPTVLEGALTNWQAAYLSFVKTGAMIGEKEYGRAQNYLAAASTNLPAPYRPLAGQFLTQLEAAFNKPVTDESERMDLLGDVCTSLHAYSQAAKLKAAAHAKDAAGDESDDDLLSWRLIETGHIPEAIAEYKRRLADATVSTFQEYYQKQIDLLQQHSTNPTNVAIAMNWVRDHYLAGFEGPADLFCGLKELTRVLPYVRNTSEGLALHRLIIQCLSGLNDDPGREAWEDKMLKESKSDADASAETYLNRGIRAYTEKNYTEALALFAKVCREFPDSDYYGDALYNTGSTLQDQQKYDEAIEAYSKIFNSKANEYKLTPGTSEDYKLYRHKSAIRISECYEAKQEYQRALDFAELARTQYKPLSWCHTCLQNSKEALERRIVDLQARLSPVKTGTAP